MLVQNCSGAFCCWENMRYEILFYHDEDIQIYNLCGLFIAPILVLTCLTESCYLEKSLECQVLQLVYLILGNLRQCLKFPGFYTGMQLTFLDVSGFV